MRSVTVSLNAAGDEHADRRTGLLEALDDLLLVDLGDGTIEDTDLIASHAEVVEQLLAQPPKCRNPLGEDDGALGALRSYPDLLEVFE